MKRIVLALMIMLATTSALAACPWRDDFVSPMAKAQPASLFEDITLSQPMPDIVAKLGPASREAGSGLHVLEWDVTDGRVFFVSTRDACGKPLNLGFRSSAAGAVEGAR
jgi:hypothetical protein